MTRFVSFHAVCNDSNLFTQDGIHHKNPFGAIETIMTSQTQKRLNATSINRGINASIFFSVDSVIGCVGKNDGSHPSYHIPLVTQLRWSKKGPTLWTLFGQLGLNCMNNTYFSSRNQTGRA
jgi:hypothetical protein